MSPCPAEGSPRTRHSSATSGAHSSTAPGSKAGPEQGHAARPLPSRAPHPDSARPGEASSDSTGAGGAGQLQVSPVSGGSALSGVRPWPWGAEPARRFSLGRPPVCPSVLRGTNGWAAGGWTASPRASPSPRFPAPVPPATLSHPPPARLSSAPRPLPSLAVAGATRVPCPLLCAPSHSFFVFRLLARLLLAAGGAACGEEAGGRRGILPPAWIVPIPWRRDLGPEVTERRR